MYYVAAPFVSAIAMPLTCKRPNKATMGKIKSDYIIKRGSYFSDSFNLLYKHNKRTDRQIPAEFKSNRTLNFEWIPKMCPLERNDNPCPHYYALDVDDNRIPKMLLQAKCRCSECSLNDGVNKGERSFECSEVFYYPLVMRVTKCSNESDSRMQFEEVLESVSAGCACKRKRLKSKMSSGSIKDRE